MLLWSVAMATDPTAALDGMDAHLVQVRSLVERADAWWAAPEAPDRVAQGTALRAELVGTASANRTHIRNLSGVRSALKSAKKPDAEALARADATEARLVAENPARMVAVALMDAGLGMEAVRAGDATAWTGVNNALYNAFRDRGQREAPPDVWLHPPLALAVQSERWDVAHGLGTYCAAVCVDKQPATDALAKLPERGVRKDVRWVTLAEQAAAPTP